MKPKMAKWVFLLARPFRLETKLSLKRYTRQGRIFRYDMLSAQSNSGNSPAG